MLSTRNKCKSFPFKATLTQYLEMSILFSICHRQFSLWYSISHWKNHTQTQTQTSHSVTERLTQLPYLWIFQTNTHTQHISQEFWKLWDVREAFLFGNTGVWLPFQMRMSSMNLLSETANAVILIVPSSTAVAHQSNQSGGNKQWKSFWRIKWKIELSFKAQHTHIKFTGSELAALYAHTKCIN